MADVQIKVEVQNSSGNVQKRATLAVPDDITKGELLSALADRYSKLVDARSSILVEWPANTSASGRFITNGALVIVRPRSSGVRFLDEE